MFPFEIRPIPPLLPVQRDEPRERFRPTDSKIRGIVLGQIQEVIQRVAGVGGLFSSTTAPPAIVELVDAHPPLPESHGGKSNGKKKKKQGRGGSLTPIGLKRGEPAEWVNWVNAVMQFLLHVPGFADLCYFAPKHFDPLQDFIDQYRLDQSEGRELSSADTSALLQCLFRFLPSALFEAPEKGQCDLLLKGLIHALFPGARPPPKIRLLPFQKENHLIWEGEGPLGALLEAKCLYHPQELLVTLRKEGGGAKRQIALPGDFLYYDLGALIEKRESGGRGVSWVTYVKVGGIWYQCDEERVRQIPSVCLEIPLAQSVLLYYKKVFSPK